MDPPRRRPLGSTYRLQLHGGLGFAGARRLVPYLHQLGVETLYCAPVLAAVPGSTHGYDVADPSRLDPALGGDTEFEVLLTELECHDMRLLVDLVPNHLAADRSDPWWWATLAGGPKADGAEVFDIDWSAHGGRVLVPTLPRPLAECLQSGAEVVDIEGSRQLRLGGQRFPLDPAGAPDPGPLSVIEATELLEAQHYRPAYWRLAASEGNYRRFFDIDGLAGVRVEDPAVFARTHGRVLDLLADPRVAGARIDHVDGLADPAAYLHALAAEVAARRADPAVLVVEKILGPDESFPETWPVDGTTGYEFADLAGALLVTDAGRRAHTAAPGSGPEPGASYSFEALARAAKGQVLAASFGAVLDRLSALAEAALDQVPGHDLSRAAVRRALAELTIALDVYRTYGRPGDWSTDDLARLHAAESRAAAALDPEAARALTAICAGLAHGAGPHWAELAVRWPQLSGAVAAKGVEDRATYRFGGLAGHCEVGSRPDRPGLGPAAFVAAVCARASTQPGGLNTTSTHDAKRSEDARSRLYALSEWAREWAELVGRWHARHTELRVALGGPDPHDEQLAYQSLAAIWPLRSPAPAGDEVDRVGDYLVKAAREAGRQTSWTDPVVRYEDALRQFVAAVTDPVAGGGFGHELSQLLAEIGPASASNALALTVLKVISPGVPDLYQGTELWRPMLTDPDNRRPVDFDRRQVLLGELTSAGAGQGPGAWRELVAHWPDGRIKLALVQRLLWLRRRHAELFDRGECRSLAVTGPGADHALGLVRQLDGRWVLAVVPRLTRALAGPGRFAVGRQVWGDTQVHLPAGAPHALVDAATGADVTARSGALAVGDLLADLPFAVLSA